MNFLSAFVFLVLVTYSNGLPVVLCSTGENLPSCPILLDQFVKSAPLCSVSCFEDDDCQFNGFICCATNCGTRCVAEAILQQHYQLQDAEEREETGDDETIADEIPGDLNTDLQNTKVGTELDILKQKLAEMRDEEEQENNETEFKGDETTEEVMAEEEEETKEEEEKDEEEEEGKEEEEEEEEEEAEEEEEEAEEEEAEQEGEDNVKIDEAVDEEEDSLTTEGPVTGTTESNVEGEETLEEEVELEEDANADEEDAEDTEKWDDYEENDSDEDLEMLLMELLYDLKTKQNSKQSPWKEESYASRSLLQRNEHNKYPGRRSGDFMDNAMPPPEALEPGTLNEETRALDDQLGGYFIDRAFKMDEMKNQEAAGRRSSMEKRDEGFVDKEQKDNQGINRSNIMKR